MNDPLHEFAELAARARGDVPPPIDVRDRVLGGLRAVQPAQAVDRTMLICGTLALAASLLVATMCFDVWSTLTDPLSGFAQSAALVVMQ